MEYVRGQGDLSFQGICEAKGRFLRPLGVSQDKIGWRRFMEGMVSKEFEQQHEAAYQSGRSRLSGKAWVRHLVQRLLEFTHGIWIYRNALMHDNMSLGF